MDNCIFCKIVKGEIPSFKVYEDENFLAILDISQFTRGHTIVIPKGHFRFIWDVKLYSKYFALIRRISSHYMNLGFKYVDSMSWGRMIEHAHFHLIPHNGEDNDWRKSLKAIGEMQQDQSRRPSKEEGEKIAKEFRLPE